MVHHPQHPTAIVGKSKTLIWGRRYVHVAVFGDKVLIYCHSMAMV